MPPALYRRNTDTSNSSSTSTRYSDSSDHSHHSHSTAPSYYSSPASRPSLGHFRHQSAGGRLDGYVTEASPNTSFDPRESSETYASTVPSYGDLPGDSDDEILEYADDYIECDATPSTSTEFAELFPSTRRLKIRHDDSTLDGNMNLRVDTEVSVGGGQRRDVILFHLKMKDLLEREFSLRRYCRDSGREVCHSCRKQTHSQPTPPRRPGLQRSVSNALASFRGKQEPKLPVGLKRADSGYESMVGEDEEEEGGAGAGADAVASQKPAPQTSSKVTLEFSNYAHVDVKRRGTKGSKRYDFDYWGTEYFWKRTIKKDGESREVSYHLVDGNTMQTVAHIVPEPMTPAQAEEELAKGGWVPPCSLWISDDKILNAGLTDVADVIVATGLIALVDDSIHRRFHRKKAVQLVLPVPMKTPLKMNMEYVGPKRLIDEVFHRRRTTPNRSPTTLRMGTPITAAS